MKKKSIRLINFSQNSKVRLNNKKNILFLGPWYKKKKSPIAYSLKNTIDFCAFENKKIQEKEIRLQLRAYETLLSFLHKNLNKIHKKKFSKFFWEILLNRWLSVWIKQVYFRWEYLNKIYKKYDVREILNRSNFFKTIIPENTLHAHNIHRGDVKWSEMTFDQIFNYQNKKKNCDIKILKKNYSKNFPIKFPYFSLLKNKNKIFFYDLNVDKYLKLQIRKEFKFYTIYLYNQNVLRETYESKLRESFDNYFFKSKKISFVNFLITTLKYNFPKIFLENFNELEKLYNKMKWPKNPEYILTSYGQYYDELFKYYVAKKKNEYTKTKLLILQHGYANIFIKNDFYNVFFDRKISDKFLCWGHNNYQRKKNIPFFYPKISKSKIKRFKFDAKKKIILITYNFSSDLLISPNSSISGDSLNKITFLNITKFLNEIKHPLNNKIYLKNLNLNTDNNFEESIKKKFNFLKFINEKEKFLDVVKDFNIFVHFYFGTPFFETLLMNKPTVIIYHKNSYQDYDEKFLFFLKKLIKEKILFEDIKKASKFLRKNYYNLEDWWNSKKLQKTRNDFCREYCLATDKPIEVLKKIIF